MNTIKSYSFTLKGDHNTLFSELQVELSKDHHPLSIRDTFIEALHALRRELFCVDELNPLLRSYDDRDDDDENSPKPKPRPKSKSRNPRITSDDDAMPSALIHNPMTDDDEDREPAIDPNVIPALEFFRQSKPKPSGKRSPAEKRPTPAARPSRLHAKPPAGTKPQP